MATTQDIVTEGSEALDGPPHEGSLLTVKHTLVCTQVGVARGGAPAAEGDRVGILARHRAGAPPRSQEAFCFGVLRPWSSAPCIWDSGDAGVLRGGVGRDFL